MKLLNKLLLGNVLFLLVITNCKINAQNILYFEDFSKESKTNSGIITPLIDFSDGISLLSLHFNNKNVKDSLSEISIFLKSPLHQNSILLAKFVPKNDTLEHIFYIPHLAEKSTILILGLKDLSLPIAEVKILHFKNATAYSENQNVFIDSLNNLQPHYYKIAISSQQPLNYPELTKAEIGNTMAVPVICPANSVIENEPDCHTGYKDSTNRGCNSDLTMPEAFSQLYKCKGTVCGKAGTYLDGIQSRDVDWYLLPGVGTVTVSLKVVADFRVKIYVISMISGCTVFQQSTAASAYAGDTATVNYTTSSGTTAIAFWVGPYYDYGVTCGANYVLKYSLLNNVITPAVPVAAMNPSCSPTQLLPMSAVSGYTFYWQGNSCGHSVLSPASSAYLASASGTYYVNAIYNSIGCWTDCSSVNLNIASGIEATANHDSICAGNSAVLTATGATTYVWTPGNLSGSQITVSPATTTLYTVTSTIGSCNLTDTIRVKVNPLPNLSLSATASSICNGDSTILSVSSSVLNTTYTWNPGNYHGSSYTVKPQSTSTYTVTGTTSSGCASTNNATITVYPVPSINITASSQAICKGNQVKLKAHSSITPASFVWYPGGLTGDSITVSPLTSTTYTVIASTSHCSNSASINITVNPVPELTLSQSSTTICAGDSATLSISSNTPTTSFIWSTGNLTGNSIVVKPIITTSYSVTGTTDNGCSAVASTSVTVHNLPNFSVSANPQVICKGEPTILKAVNNSGTSVFQWQPENHYGDSLTVSPDISTVYSISANNSYCSKSSTISVTVNPLPELSLACSNATLCPGDSAILDVLSNIPLTNFSWTPIMSASNQIIVKPLTNTNYSVTGTSPLGCSASKDTTIHVIVVPQASISTTSPAICYGNQTTLTAHIASGNATYHWIPGNITADSITVSPSQTLTYTLIANTGTCYSTAIKEIIVNPLPSITITPSAYSICQGDTSILIANSSISPIAFSWQPGNYHTNTLFVSPNASATYTLAGTVNATGCSSNTSVTINVNTVPVINISASPDSICSGNSSILKAHAISGTSNYSWMPGGFTGDSIMVAPGNSTIYTVTATSSNCTGSASIGIIVNPLPIVSIINSQASICLGDSSLLSASSTILPAGFVWQPGNFIGNSINVFPLTTTIYTLIGTVHNTGCSSSANSSVTVKSVPIVAISATPAAFCSGNTSVLKAICAMDSVSFLWTPNNITADSINVAPTSSSTYTVIGTHVNGCSSDASVNLVVYPLPGAASAISGLTEVCANTNGTSYIVPSIQDALLYHWNYSGTGSTIMQNGNAIAMNFSAGATSGNLTVYGENNCGNGTASPALAIAIKPLPIVSASANPTSICTGENTQLSAQGTASSYLWNPGNISGTPVTVAPGQTTTYTLTGNLNGCSDSTTIPVVVELCTGISDNNSTENFSVFIDNHMLSVVNNKNQAFSIKLFSMNGQLVYSSKFIENTKASIDISAFSTSVYFLQVQGEYTSKTYKFFIE